MEILCQASGPPLGGGGISARALGLVNRFAAQSAVRGTPPVLVAAGHGWPPNAACP